MFSIKLQNSQLITSNQKFFLSNRTTTMHHLTNSTDTTVLSENTEISKHESADWKWKVVLTGLTAILSITVCLFILSK